MNDMLILFIMWLLEIHIKVIAVIGAGIFLYKMVRIIESSLKEISNELKQAK